jgi:hypothetical protein
VVTSILTNEKYSGNALLQKEFTVDFLTKKRKANQGEVPQYFVRGSHPAIIEPDMFDLVQYEIKRRRDSGRWASSIHPVSGKIFCGACDGVYGSKIRHPGDKYRRTYWQCNDKYQGNKCRTPFLTDAQIQAAFLAAYNERLDDKAEILAAYDEVLRVLTDNSTLDEEAAKLKGECETVMELIRQCMKENANVAQDQGEYRQRFDGLLARYEALRERLTKNEALRVEHTAKRTNITRFLQALEKHDALVTEFDDELWYIAADSIRAHEDGRLVVIFRDGSEVAVAAEVWKKV